MESQSTVLKKKYPRNSLGFVCEIHEPIHISHSLSQVEKYFNENDDCHAIPVEGEAGIIGIVERHRVLGQAKKGLGKLVGSTINEYLNENPLILNARDNIEYALNVVFQSPNSWEIRNIQVNQRGRNILGTVNIRQLIYHIMNMRKEQLKEAEAIQDSLIGRKTISEPFLLAEIAIEMAYELGGDYTQLLQLKQSKYLLACFDVSGKNLSAAIYTGLITGYFSTLEVTGIINQLKTEDILKGLNRMIYEKTNSELYITAIFVYVDAVEKSIEVYNCGYNTFFFSTSNNSNGLQKFNPTLPPLGLDDEWDPLPGRERFSVSKGDRLFTFSDGLTDAKNIHGEQYGEERVLNFIEKNWSHSGKDFFATFLDRIHTFIGEAVRVDDLTLMMLQF